MLKEKILSNRRWWPVMQQRAIAASSYCKDFWHSREISKSLSQWHAIDLQLKITTTTHAVISQDRISWSCNSFGIPLTCNDIYH